MVPNLNIHKLATVYLTNDKTMIEWLQSLGLLPKEKKCPKCKRLMKLNVEDGKKRFRCYRTHRSRPGVIEIPLSRGTWFEGAKFGFREIILMTYSFAWGFTYKQAIRETSLTTQTAASTVADWYHYCREVCLMSLGRHYQFEDKIGGEGRTVEIDECKVAPGKVRKDRVIEEQWLLCMVELGGGCGLENTNFRVELYVESRRGVDTLMSLVEKHVVKNTTVMTGCYEGYDLSVDGFRSVAAGHSYAFVDPDTWLNNEPVESTWRPLRDRLGYFGLTKDALADHLCEYLWRKHVKKNKLDSFTTLLDDIKNLYPVK